MAVVKGLLAVVVFLSHGSAAMAPLKLVANSRNTFGDEIDDLADVQDDAEARSSDHEVGEDLLLSGMADVAVHQVRARRPAALNQSRQVEAVVDVVEDVEERNLDARLGEEADHIGPPQATVLLARVGIQLDAVWVLYLVFALTVITVRHVHHHHKRWAGDEDELQGPQADVGDGEEVVVADVGAAGLLGVAVKVLLLVAPHSLRRHHVHHDPEHEHHRQPYPPERRRVFVHPTEEGLEGLPVHVLGWPWSLSLEILCCWLEFIFKPKEVLVHCMLKATR